MSTKCPCQHCGGHIKFEAEDFMPGTRIDCPHCHQKTLLFIPPPTPRQVPGPPTIGEKTPKQRIAAHLAFIRANSSYRFLRDAINVCFVLAVIGVFICVAILVGDNLDSIQLPVSLFIGGAALVVFIAFRQSAMLLVDIADTLLHEHSKNSNNP